MLRTAALLSLLLAAGCGSSAELTVEEFLTQYPTAYCAYLQRCCDAVERSYSATAICQQAVSTDLSELFAFREAPVPHAQLSPSAARACLGRLRSGKCLEEKTLAMGCAADAVTPLQQEGGECTYSAECASVYCVQPQKNVLGSCGKRGGSSCSGDDRACSEGSYCNGLRQCTPKAENAKPCARPADCQSGICSPSAKICVTRPDPWCDGI